MFPKDISEESGYCFRDALNQAGYSIELPSWLHIDDVPIVCDELGLRYLTGKGKTVTLKKGEPCIIGHIVQRRGKDEKRIGHWTYAKKPEEVLQRIKSEDIFALIPVP